jgi:methionine synthase II (cobalamin-independent)
MQVRAGIDVISDGEWRWESYIKVIAEHVDGFKSGLVRSLKHVVDDPAVVGPIKRREDLTTEAASFLLSHTSHDAIRLNRSRQCDKLAIIPYHLAIGFRHDIWGIP